MGLSYYPDDSSLNDLISFSVFNEPSLVQFIHRNLAYIILIFYLFLIYKIYMNKLAKFYFVVNLIGILLLVQIVLGILTLLHNAQILLSSMHQISSIFLVSASILFLYSDFLPRADSQFTEEN